MPNGVGGRIKPMTNLSLCVWNVGVVNVTQIVRDFDYSDKFELHPFNRGDNTSHPDGPMCLSNHHHPKREEVIRGENCTSAREDKSSFGLSRMHIRKETQIPSMKKQMP